MRLLIISHTEHFMQDGRFFGWGPTVREIDQLSLLFEQVDHITFLYPGAPPPSALPYQASNVSVIPVPASGGDRLRAKLGILWNWPLYLRTISRVMKAADVIHVRCPANISMLAIVLLSFRRTPQTRWIKYAGNWQPEAGEPWSYVFQRWWLKKGLSRACVTVNGSWPYQPDHVHSMFNPSFNQKELQHNAAIVKSKELTKVVKMVFAGRLESAKGIGMALDILAVLRRNGIDASLDVAGDGPERILFERKANALQIDPAVQFHGWLPHTQMKSLYEGAQFILLPTSSEGWPKVLSEAMAYGVVPIASDVSSIGQYLRQFSVGRAILPGDMDGFVDAIKSYVQNEPIWKEESERARSAAENFTYETYLRTVRTLLGAS